jgi:hypothetical protein
MPKREFLTLQSFLKVLQKQAPLLNQHRAKEAFIELDSIGEGFVTFFDFAAAMRSDVP